MKNIKVILFPLVAIFVAGLFLLVGFSYHKWFYRNHISTIVKSPIELESKLKELGVIECYGTFTNQNPFKRRFIAIYVSEKRKGTDGKIYAKYKYDTGFSTENIATMNSYEKWEYKNCSQVAKLDAKYPLF